MSKALDTLQKNIRDLDHLLGIHKDITGVRRGRRGPEANVLNRSAIVLGCAAWEAYLEDVCIEAIEFLRNKAGSERAIPGGIKHAVIDEMKPKGKPDVVYWKLSDEKWRRKAIKRAVAAITGRFQNPSAEKTRDLLRQCLALPDVGKAWPRDSQTQIDRFVGLRHEIAHGSAAKVVHKRHVQKFRDLLLKMGKATDKKVATHVESLLVDEQKAIVKAMSQRPGRKPRRKKNRRGRPPKLRPW